MVESLTHEQLKRLGRMMLKTMGFKEEEIQEEYRLQQPKKSLIVDIVGMSKKRDFSVAIEDSVKSFARSLHKNDEGHDFLHDELGEFTLSRP